MSHLQELNELNAQNIAAVCGLLKIKFNRYCELFHETGCLYLEKRYVPSYANVLKENKIFWAWWKQEYMLIDKVFLRDASRKITNRTISYYTGLHVGISYMPGKNITGKIINEKAAK